MPEIRRTIMNTFKDTQECQMFVMILKQKWSEFDVKLKDKLTLEIATDVADARKHTAYWTAQSVEDFKLVEEWAAKGKTNLWGTIPDVVEMQSEAGAIGAVHGALL